MFNNIKTLISQDTFFYTVVIISVGIVSFGLGRLSNANLATEHVAPVIQLEQASEDSLVKDGSAATEGLLAAPEAVGGDLSAAPIFASDVGTYVASRKGSKYHLPSCPGAKQMSEENKIWFKSKEEAERLGYTPAANCPGL